VLHDRDVRQVLIVAAHPDDVDFGAAGSVAQWTSDGVEVAYCIVTNGEAGGFDDRVTRAEVPAMRQAEQRAAAAVAGVSDVTFLGYPDGRLVASIELRRDITRVIRRVQPQRVVCQSPQRMWGRLFASHPDHLAAGEAALGAVYPDSRNPYSFAELLDEGLRPWTVDEVWMMAHDQTNRWVDITATVDRKVKALLCHVSQLSDPGAIDGRIRAWTDANAAAAGLPPGSFAEGFFAIDTAG
jgi:LmbE family N-acetylglucosaminyl deacetylase